MIDVLNDSIAISPECCANEAQFRKIASNALVKTVERLDGGTRTSPKTLQQAMRLYEACFPNPDEREPSEEIVERLKRYERQGGPDADGGLFVAHVLKDAQGDVIGYTQGSCVPTSGSREFFFYWQYGCVADANYVKRVYGREVNPRNGGASAIIHAVCAASLLAHCAARKPNPATPLGTMWECEPVGLGETPEEIRYTKTRMLIHNRGGGRVMLGMSGGGRHVNLHLQPRLTKESSPIALLHMFRPLKYENSDLSRTGVIPTEEARRLVAAWFDNFLREGFAKSDVEEAREVVLTQRFPQCARILLLPPGETPDAVTLAEMGDAPLAALLCEMYEVKTLQEVRAKMNAALSL